MSKTLSSGTYWAKIFIAGPVVMVEQICRDFVMDESLCVTVTPTKYIYVGGEEEGVEVGLINYPRFPKQQEDIKQQAIRLAQKLMEEMFQGSYTVMTPDETIYFSRREDFAR